MALGSLSYPRMKPKISVQLAFNNKIFVSDPETITQNNKFPSQHYFFLTHVSEATGNQNLYSVSIIPIEILFESSSQYSSFFDHTVGESVAGDDSVC